MSERGRRAGGQAVSYFSDPGAWRNSPGGEAGTPDRLSACSPELCCNRCGFPVISRPWGCKNPCANCGTVYPLGDCSD